MVTVSIGDQVTGKHSSGTSVYGKVRSVNGANVHVNTGDRIVLIDISTITRINGRKAK